MHAYSKHEKGKKDIISEQTLENKKKPASSVRNQTLLLGCKILHARVILLLGLAVKQGRRTEEEGGVGEGRVS